MTPPQDQLDFTLPDDQPPTPGTPRWTTEALQAAHLIRAPTRAARLNTCPTCGALTFYGYDDDTAAGQARTDIATLTPEQATILHAAGRTLYHLATTPTTYRLHWISGPAAIRPHLVDHRCGYPTTGPPPFTATNPPKTRRNDPPPF